MDQTATEYVLRIYPYPKKEGPPSSEVRMEISCGIDRMMDYILIWLAGFNADAIAKIDPKANVDEIPPRFLVCDEIGGKPFKAYCDEESIIHLLLYCCKNPGVAVRELTYQGNRYTDISDISFSEAFHYYFKDIRDKAYTYFRLYAGVEDCDDFYTYSVKLQAKKDGCDTQVYLFGPCIHGGLEITDGNIEASNCGNFDIYPLYLLSHGIVETDGKRTHYAGSFYCFREYEISDLDDLFSDDRESSPDQKAPKKNDVKHEVACFLETDGANLTFSLLLDGKLYPKISKDDERVVFHYTPFDKTRLDSEHLSPSTRTPDLQTVVFERENGVYRYAVGDVDPGEKKGIVFTPPPVPEHLNEELAHKLCEDYITALYAAFFGMEEIKSFDSVFQRAEGTEDRFRAELTDVGYTVTGVLDFSRPDAGCMQEGYPYLHCADIDVERISFRGENVEISMILQDGDLILEAEDALHQTHRSSLRSLNAQGFFSKADLPKTLWFSQHFGSVLSDLGTFNAIRKTILTFGATNFVRRISGRAWKSFTREELSRKLFGDGMVPDEGVVSTALEMQNEFIRTGRIPNIALIGEPGTGKSTLANKLARAVFGKGIMVNTPSDLKGKYIGHTKSAVLKRLIEAAQNDQIFFIDEVYTLLQDNFGREAVTLLLPLMTGDNNLESLSAEQDGATMSINFVKGEVSSSSKDGTKVVTPVTPGFPIIWIAGYEDDVRLMLHENQGLYRRFKRITLTPPAADQLFHKLIENLEAEKALTERVEKEEFPSQEDCERLKLIKNYLMLSQDKREEMTCRLDTLLEQYRNYEEPIIKFFRWGAQPQNSKYFANYAGVESFISRCLDGIEFDKPADEIKQRIDQIITETKKDIKRQLDTVRRKGGLNRRNEQNNADAGDQVNMIEDNKTRFRDLVGCDSQVAEMRKIVDMLLKKGEYERFGITVPKGALLEGLPGVGKTFIAGALAGELQEAFEREARGKRVGFMSLSAPELTSKPVSFLSSIFGKAEEYDACVIFIDEVDAIAKRRFLNNYYSHFIELIKQMDGMEQRSNVFLLAATNAPESLDPAFVRSGRIDLKLAFRLPDRAALAELTRRNILKRCERIPGFQVVEQDGRKQLKKKQHMDGVRELAEAIAENLDGRGCTAGDVENIVNTAFVMYAQELDGERSKRSPRKKLDPSVPKFGDRELGYLYRHLYEAAEQHFIGAPGQLDRKETFSVERNSESRASTAVHEVGHALVHILSGSAPFEKITCLPRGDALGYVMPSQDELYTKADYQSEIRCAMGGRVAEEVVYGRDNISPGALQDMRQATYYARRMVEQWGFVDEFEFMALKETTARYLGESEYACSDAFRGRVDQAVSELLKKLYQETKGMLSDKRELIITLAKEVFKRKTMTGEEFKKLYAEKKK